MLFRQVFVILSGVLWVGGRRKEGGGRRGGFIEKRSVLGGETPPTERAGLADEARSYDCFTPDEVPEWFGGIDFAPRSVTFEIS